MPRIIIPKSNKRLKREYRMRFFVSLILVCLIGAMAFVVSLLPSYILLGSYQEVYSRPTLEGTDEIEKLNQEYTDKLFQVHALSKNVVIKDSMYPDVLDMLFSYAQNGTVIDSIELGNTDGSVTITIRGVSATRDTLLSFEKNILANNNFKGFDLPIEALTKQSDIPFNVTFTYHEE